MNIKCKNSVLRLDKAYMLLCFLKCQYKISKTPQNQIVLVRAAVSDLGEAFRVQFIIGEVQNTDDRITALWR